MNEIFLSCLRLAIMLAIAGIAITGRIRLISDDEPKYSLKPEYPVLLGCVFVVLSILCLLFGILNYYKTLKKYEQRRSYVQMGWQSQLLALVIGLSALGMTLMFLITERH